MKGYIVGQHIVQIGKISNSMVGFKSILTRGGGYHFTN